MTMGAYLCFYDFSTVFSEFFRLSLLSVNFFTLTLFCQSFHFNLFFLCLDFSKFFFCVGNIDLPHIVEININLLCPCFSHTLCFINHNLVNEFGKHQIGNFCRLFALAYQRNEMLSFECRAGEVTAIIGRTGCGKSSILKLIPRLYDATVGHVYVDDMNVKQYKLNELRDLIGYIPQKNVLFSGDVASNLRFGDQDSSEEQWRQAAYVACADEFIEQKPDGYHAEIAQGGTNLSGGQRQRMAIARAVVKKPEIYLFDDSFSALDVKTDKTLRMRLRESMGDSTMLIVAQRVGSILDADRILVMEDGQIVGRGKHRELLHTCPLYREIAELQLGEEEVKHELECV